MLDHPGKWLEDVEAEGHADAPFRISRPAALAQRLKRRLPCAVVVPMRKPSALTPALVVSLACHVALAIAIAVLVRSHAGSGPGTAATATPDRTPVIWLSQEGFAGGGGGGGNESPLPPQRVQRRGEDRATTPISQPPDVLNEARREATPPEGLDLPALARAADVNEMPGTLQAAPGPPTDSRGPGRDGGAGDGAGPGDGPGRGRGLGPGQDRGHGGDVYRIGSNGVTPPVPLYRGAPRYTSEAVQARLQGSILVECIVQTNGVCTDARVLRSFEPPLGLESRGGHGRGAMAFQTGAARWRAGPRSRHHRSGVLDPLSRTPCPRRQAPGVQL